MRKLAYSVLPGKYAICRLDAGSPIPAWAAHAVNFSSITHTADELSIVYPEHNVPVDVKASRGWLCLKLHGPFPLSETGILTSLITPLSAQEIPIFAVATYDTDYVLVEEKSWARARELLLAAGHVGA
jgi:hypothetical protein